MSKDPATHDICIAENYEAKDGEAKTKFTNVGGAWLNPSGTMSCETREGIALTGRFMILPKREKADADKN